jgi:hypothetical protein
MKYILVAAVMAAGLATPALADPNCLNDGAPGLRVHVGINTGNITEQDQMDFDVLNARRHGIDADTAERTWLGCLKITRRAAGGGWVTEYYDPDTFRLKPLDLTLPE